MFCNFILKQFLFITGLCLLSTLLIAEDFTFKANDNCHVGNIGAEKDFNGGNKTTRGKIKGPEEYVLVNFDLSSIKGKTVTKAKLRIYSAGAILYKVGFSSVTTKWTGGSGNSFKKYNGPGATWRRPSPGKFWAWKGNSNLEHVVNSMSGSRSCYGQAKKIGNYYELDLSPEVIEAVASGHHHGFMISEHDGWRRSSWVKQYLFKQSGGDHNPKIFLKEQNGKAPTLFISAEKTDSMAPGKVQAKTIWKDNMLIGEVLIELIATGDDGNKGKALYYEILADGKEVPAWMLNAPLAAGAKQLIRISEQTPGKEISFSIRAVDEAGNKGPPTTFKAKSIPSITIPAVKARYVLGAGSTIKNKTVEVWAYPDLEKANPITGNILEDKSYFLKKTGTYRNGNNVWDGKTHTVKLTALKDEWVAFQIGIENISGAQLKDIKVEWSSDKNLSADLYREWYVKFGDSFYPDPLVPLEDLDFKISIPDDKNSIEGHKVQSVYVDLLVDRKAKTGIHNGKVTITVPGQSAIVVKVAVDVTSVNMPRKLNTIIEFNHYSSWEKNFKGGSKRGDQFIKYNNDITALAHQNRCTFNGVPYGHNGNLSRPAPKISGEGANIKVTSWEAFDKTYEGIYSGSIFKNNHRSEQPMTHHTLKFFESWPANFHKPGMFVHDRKKNPSLNPMFSKKYNDQVLAMGKEYVKHFKEKSWNKVQLQLFLNNKNQYYRKGSGCYWLLDEPRYHNGYMALDYLGTLFRKAFSGHGEIDVVFRADISRPQYQETMQDDSLDLLVVGGLPEHEYIVRRNSDRYNGNPFRKGDQIIWNYGSVSGINTNNYGFPNARIMDYFKGGDGHLPWLNSFAENSWREQKIKNYSLMYNGQSKYSPAKSGRTVVPSMRLKAYRRAQQDTEMIGLALVKNHYTRDQFRVAIATFANFVGKTIKLFREDAGTVQINISTEKLEGTREVLRALMGGKKPFNTKQNPRSIDKTVGEIGKLTFKLSADEKVKAEAVKVAKKDEAKKLEDMMKNKPAWVENCINIHKKFKGEKFFYSTLGDSITYTGAFATPISWKKHPANLVFKWRNKLTPGLRGKGPKFGNYSGWTSSQLLNSVPNVIKQHKPELAIILIGTNDVNKGGNVTSYEKNLNSIVDKLIASGCVPILTTIPPCRNKIEKVKSFNVVVHKIAKAKNIPTINYFEEIMSRSNGKWENFISKDGVHPNTSKPRGFYTPGSGKGGYELRNTLTAQKLFQVMTFVLGVK
ncbi:MAG: hypothetical protein COA79_04565 [Planctomycetota bacterium]|nr:MAG: hypothetical protein COA79_04565 [Planctomycetota bacterium]